MSLNYFIGIVINNTVFFTLASSLLYAYDTLFIPLYVFTDLGDSLLKICCSSSSKLFLDK